MSGAGGATGGGVQPALSIDVSNGIAIVTFDLPGEPVNKFTAGVVREFIELIDRCERDESIRAAVLLSAKPDVWIAGADIEQFLEWKTADDAETAARNAQAVFARVERMRVPIVCGIHGACLGGGLELAITCAHRVASDHPKTVLGLPETQLGIIPGIGGTQRLPRLIGLQGALEMILTARSVRAKKALKSGLVDELVHPAILREIAVQRAQEFATGQRRRQRGGRKHSATSVLLEDNPVGRALVFRQAREAALKKSRGHYPAIPAAIEAVAAGYDDRDKGFATEARLFGDCAATQVSKELVYLFFATTSLKRESGVADPSVAPAAIHRVGVLGTGFMGAGIAAITAQQMVPVRFKDAKHDAVLRGLGSVRDILKESLTRKRITRQQFADQLSLVGGTLTYDGFQRADLVIEAVFEDLDVKHQVLREAEAVLPAHAIFATNTSTIPIARIADAAARPEQVIGMHFFSPVNKMPLLEVITTPRTAPETVATVVAFGRRLGKTVIVVNDSPGFYVNRILSPYINEAGRMIDEGVAIDAIDAALVSFGFPVGPITLIDEVGLDIAGKSGAIMFEALGERLAPAQSLRAVLAAGRLGRKGRKGFYTYDEDGKKGDVDESVYDLLGAKGPRHELPEEEIQRRCVLAMVNEAARCLDEGILRNARDGDIGAVFGIGFPPFRGGPFRHVDALGAARVVDTLERLNLSHAGRYTPAPMLAEMARAGRRFHPADGRPVD